MILEDELDAPGEEAPRLQKLLSLDRIQGGTGRAPRRRPIETLSAGIDYRIRQAAIDLILGFATSIHSSVRPSSKQPTHSTNFNCLGSEFGLGSRAAAFCAVE